MADPAGSGPSTERVPADEEGLQRAASLLEGGGVAAYPTETQYGVGCHALHEEALEQVRQLKQRDEGPFLCVAADREMVNGLAEGFGAIAATIADAFWPGPVTLLLSARDGLPAALVGEEGLVGVRVSGHPAARRLPELLGAPVVSTSANLKGAPPIVEPEEIAGLLGSGLDLIVDGGRLRPGPPSTLVDGRRTPVRVFREGAVSANSLARRTGLEVEGGRPNPLVAVVCTGNTCRSPMAEGILEKLLREKGLEEEVDVVSAGVAAVHWGKAVDESQRTAWEYGIDISAHRPRQLTPGLAREADLILTMSEYHRNRIAVIHPETRGYTYIIEGLGGEWSGRRRRGRREIIDPIGRPQKVYRKVFEEMQEELGSNLEGIVERASARRAARNREREEAE
ncbi:MAG: L-threonylcarbamoyladenylate synthase [bacterium]